MKIKLLLSIFLFSGLSVAMQEEEIKLPSFSELMSSLDVNSSNEKNSDITLPGFVRLVGFLKVNSSIEIYKKAAKQNDNMVVQAKACIDLGVIYANKNENKKSLKWFNKAAEQNDDKAAKEKAWYNLGVVYARINESVEAVKWFIKVIKESRDDELIILCHYNLGLLYDKDNQHAKALECYRYIATRKHNDKQMQAQVYLNMGIIHEKNNKPGFAKIWLKKAIEQNDNKKIQQDASERIQKLEESLLNKKRSNQRTFKFYLFAPDKQCKKRLLHTNTDQKPNKKTKQ